VHYIEKSIVGLVAACIGLVASAVAVSAESEPEGAEVFPLPEILITAQAAEAPATLIVRKVDVGDIQAWNAHTAGDALKQVPGVNVQYGGGSGDARAWIRGFRDRDTLVLFDGIPIASAFEGTIDLNEITVGNLSTIRVMKAAPSVTYGVNGMAGIIDFIPQTDFEESEFKAAVELGGNNSEIYSASYGSSSGSLNYFLAGTHQSADDYELSDDFEATPYQPSGDRVNSDHERDSLFAYLNLEDSLLGDTSIFYNISDVERGVVPQADTDDPDFERLEKSRRQTLGLSNRMLNTPLSYKLFYNKYDSELAVYTDQTYREIDEVEEAQDYAFGGMLYSTFQTSANNALVLHARFNRDVYKAEDVLEGTDRVELNTYNVSAENQYWLTNHLSLAVGGIYTWFKQEQSGEELTAFNPQLVVAYQLTDDLSLRASAAQRTRFPRLRELYRRRYGNPDLKEQSAENYELSSEYRFSAGLSADIALFYSDLKDLIDRPDRRSLYQNLDSVTIRGVETAAGGWLTDKLFARLAYTYVDAEEDLPGGGNRQLRSRPKNTLMMEARLRLPAQILWSVNSTYLSDLYDVDDDGVYVKIDSFTVIDSKLSMAVSSRATAYLAVSNITDENYEHKLGYPREGRAYRIGLEVEF
jgi:outer membrane cobalamin receptor